jgi:hypothetical protein
MQNLNGFGWVAKRTEFLAVGCGQGDPPAVKGLCRHIELSSHSGQHDGLESARMEGGAELVKI